MSNRKEKAPLSDEEIRKLWRNPAFSGSYSGIRNFQAVLGLEKGVHKSKNDLFRILREDPQFVLEMKRVRKTFPRRKTMVHGVGRLWESDIAIMYDYESYIGFLICVDVFSRKIFCEKIKSKDAQTIRAAFKKIFAKAGLKPDILATDQGGEFLGNKLFFQKNNIYFKVKIGRQKASFAEKGIQLVKRRLYRLLRTKLTQDWPKYISLVVEAINNSPNIAIGNLRPNDIKTPEDDPKVDRAVGLKEDVSFQDQETNQKQYEKTKNVLQKGDFVHVDFGPTAFEKGYDSPNYQIFCIKEVDAGKSPVLYKLEDLKEEPIQGFFYKEQLTKTKPPDNAKTFHVEDILAEKEINGEPYIYVKYLHYPAKFNEWIPEANMVKK